MQLSDPPDQLDSAEVLSWAISHNVGGFYQMAESDPPIIVTAMVVAQYGNAEPIYLFKCADNWEVVQDWDCGSIEEARELAAQHANGQVLEWRHRYA